MLYLLIVLFIFKALPQFKHDPILHHYASIARFTVIGAANFLIIPITGRLFKKIFLGASHEIQTIALPTGNKMLQKRSHQEHPHTYGEYSINNFKIRP